MSVNAPFLSANGWLGLIAEASRGTTPGSGTPLYFATMDPKITPNLTWLNDAGFRGSPVENYNQVPATRSDTVDFKTYLYADTFPILLCGVLGGNDAVTGSGPYTHTIGLYNNATNGSQPLSYSICLFDAADYYIITGSQADSLELSFGASGAVEVTSKYMGNPWTTPTTSAPTRFASPSFSTESLTPSWNASVSIAASQFYNVQEGSLTINRKAEPIFTVGQQGPNPVFAGTCEIAGKFTIVVNSNADPFSTGASPTALTLDQQALVLLFTDPNDTHSATQDSVQFTMTAAQFEKPARSQSKSFVELEVEFVAVANTTDAISGFAPTKTVTVNGISTTYQTGH